ncbi:hypothetical protein ACRRTK_022277 [Alexandromys fortis]
MCNESSKNGLTFHLRFWGPGDHLCGLKHSRHSALLQPQTWSLIFFPGEQLPCQASSPALRGPDRQAVDMRPDSCLECPGTGLGTVAPARGDDCGVERLLTERAALTSQLKSQNMARGSQGVR